MVLADELKYRVIVDHIRSRATAGEFQPGKRLPSVRELALEYSCNKATVVRAYTELEKQHFVYGKSRSGYFLVEDASIKQRGGEGIIDLATGMPGIKPETLSNFEACIHRALEEEGEGLFTAIPPEGLASFRELLSSFLTGSQIFAKPSDIMVVSGVQQALSILAGLPFPNNRQNILVEQPTYLGVLEACRAANVNVLGVRRTREHIDLADLERLFSTGNIKFFYIIPRMHNPMGTSLSTREKKEIAGLANAHDVYIVEDDFCADLEHDSKSDPLFALDGEKSRVIYLRSFSKTLLPGLRVGAIVLPQLLQNIFREHKRAADLGGPALLQRSLEIFIKSGMLEAHHKLLRQEYRERMKALSDACDEYLPGLAARDIPECGIYAGLEVGKSAGLLKGRLFDRNVRIKNVDMGCLPHFVTDNRIRVSVCKATPEEIRAGIAAIADVLKKLPKNGQAPFEHGLE
ncbi:MAG: PLP-dependent aminotransferase family protein [Spirochaetaceae bacterium]|nr:MAG: PLP-dependent aminotransferase family protein [Spirochaetaceae bacterium]